MTGCCVAITVRRERFRANRRQLKLFEVAVLILFCWVLIIAGRFLSTVAGVNHSIVWLAYRSAADEDGIAVLAGDISEVRDELPLSENNTIQFPSAGKPQEEDSRVARERWKSLNAEEKALFLERWQVTVSGANQMSWCMIHRNSFTVAYAAPNVFWLLTGIAIAVGLGVMPFPTKSTIVANT